MRLPPLVYTIALLTFARLATGQDLPVMDGLQLWLDATDASTVFQRSPFEDPAADGDFVESWMDKSPNQYEAYVDFSSTAGVPIYQVDGIGGQPSVRFFGEFRDGMLIDGLDLQRPYTAFIVNQYWGDTRGRTLQSQDINWLLGLWAGNFGHYAEGWVNTPQPPAEVNRPYVADAVGTENESFFFINGVDWTRSSSPVGVPGALAIGGAGAFAGEISDADVSEIIIYDRVLSADELTSVRTHLYDKYGTQPVAPPPPPPQLVVHKGTLGTFSSAADLDFSGEFVYAINAGGPADDLVIGDAQFVEGSLAAQPDLDAAGARITVANEGATWYMDPDYGDTIEDDNLELIMRSIRWNVPPGLEIDLDVEAGESYQLQMLFAEEAWDRGFDIFLEGEEVVSDLVVHLAQGGMGSAGNRTVGVSYTHSLVAGDDELNILLGGSVGVPDNNPILQALTLELIEGLIIVGDCNGDGLLNAEDLACVGTIEERDAVLAALNTLPGDLDGDGAVAFADFVTLSTNFGSDLPGYQDGNIDLMDGIEFADFVILANNFNQTPAAVPEPTALALTGWLALVATAWLRRRYR